MRYFITYSLLFITAIVIFQSCSKDTIMGRKISGEWIINQVDEYAVDNDGNLDLLCSTTDVGEMNLTDEIWNGGGIMLLSNTTVEKVVEFDIPQEKMPATIMLLYYYENNNDRFIWICDKTKRKKVVKVTFKATGGNDLSHFVCFTVDMQNKNSMTWYFRETRDGAHYHPDGYDNHDAYQEVWTLTRK